MDWLKVFSIGCIGGVGILGVIAWLMWLGRKWDKNDVLPPPRRDVRRDGSVPEYPRWK